jgi:hypothetical protein
MATVKKTSGNYVIQTPRLDNGSNITLDTDNVIVTGNLRVLGNVTEFITNNTSITDRIITLNYGETGNGVSTGGNVSGVEVDRGIAVSPAGNVSILWNEDYKKWTFTEGNGIFSNISAASSTFVGANIALIYAGGIVPPPYANNAIIYADTVEGGRTGVYIVNSDVAGDELISKKRAFGLSLIL